MDWVTWALAGAALALALRANVWRERAERAAGAYLGARNEIAYLRRALASARDAYGDKSKLYWLQVTWFRAREKYVEAAWCADFKELLYTPRVQEGAPDEGAGSLTLLVDKVKGLTPEGAVARARADAQAAERETSEANAKVESAWAASKAAYLRAENDWYSAQNVRRGVESSRQHLTARCHWSRRVIGA